MPLPPSGISSRDAIPQNGSRHRQPQPGTVVLIPPQSNSNVSAVPKPVMGGVVPSMYSAAPRHTAPNPPHMLPQSTCYTYHAGPWHFTYNRREHPSRNYNVSISKSLMNNRIGNEYRPPEVTPAPVQSRWIKPTLFYDGFWTEQKVKRWISGQFLEEASQAYSDSKSIHVNRTH